MLTRKKVFGLTIATLLVLILEASAPITALPRAQTSGAEVDSYDRATNALPDSDHSQLSAPTDHPQVTAALESAPLMFTENVGQFDPEARFQVQGANGAIWLTEEGLWITILEERSGEASVHSPPRLHTSASQPGKGVNLKLSFVGANPHPRLEPFNRLDTHISYFIGNDPTKWHPDVPVWGGVRYIDIYPGMDLEVTSEGGWWIWRIVARSSQLRASDVRLQVDGVDALVLDNDRLHLTTGIGDFILPLLVLEGAMSLDQPAVSDLADQAFKVSSPFSHASLSLDTPSSGFSLSPRDNPGDLLYGTFLGGSDGDSGYAMAMDGTGAVYVTGRTVSSDFPTTAGAYDEVHSSGSDAFVSKLTPDGSSLQYSTFLGGGGDDAGTAIAVDTNGAVYIAGDTESSNFPTTSGAFDRTYNGSTDAFVTKMNSAGSDLIYSTFLGGTGADCDWYYCALAVDASGMAYVTGKTTSSDFPTTPGALDRSYSAYGDAFVTKLNTSGSDLVYSTFLGGSSANAGYAIAVDASGAAYVTGETYSPDFPTTPGAFDRTCGAGGDYGYADAFVTKLNTSGSGLLYSTFLGGNLGGDRCFAITVDKGGAVYVTGNTSSSDFPTTLGAFDVTLAPGYRDAFVTKLNASGSSLIYSTFLGDGGWDEGLAIAVDESGVAYVAGYTEAPGFPTTVGALDTSLDYPDAFVTRLNVSGSDLEYSTFLGGNGYEEGRGIVASGMGAAYVVGFTGSSDFPITSGAYDTNPNGSDAFVVKLAMGMDCMSTEDADGDGLLDGWELCGYDADEDGFVDVNLPAMGAHPLKKDVFVEVDYMVDHGVCLPVVGCRLGHSHQPKPGAIARVVEAFTNAPVSNPDGSTGIRLHVDYDPDSVMNPVTGEKWGDRSQADSLPHDVWLGKDEFDSIKAANFPSSRAGVFHYAVFAHHIEGYGCTSGMSFGAPGSDFIVSLGGWGVFGKGCLYPGAPIGIGTVNEQAGTFMHELGHNLGLHHGGGDTQNYKPNYLSVMNYSFQMDGLIIDGKDGHLDYSHFGSIPSLDEHHLDETVGLNGGSAISSYGTRYYCKPSDTWQQKRVRNANGSIDWDCSGSADGTDVKANINRTATDPTLSTLTGYDDWPKLVYDGGSIGLDSESAVLRLPTAQSVLTDELTFEVASQFYRPYSIALSGGDDIVSSLGIAATLHITLTNLGALTATVSLGHTSGSGWFDLSALPVSVTLVPSASLSIPITLTVPASRSGAVSDHIVISATVQESPLIGDSAALRARIGPLAQYMAEPVIGNKPLTVAFTDASVGDIKNWLWDFGDTVTSTLESPTHTYTEAGAYTVTLTVSGPDGESTLTRANYIVVNGLWQNVYLPLTLRGR